MRPEVELGEYKGIKIPKIEYNVTDKDVDDELKRLAERGAKIEEKDGAAENGDIVVALFDDGIEEGATVKRFFSKSGKIMLHPENSSMQDFVLDSATILGKVIGLIRSFT